MVPQEVAPNQAGSPAQPGSSRALRPVPFSGPCFLHSARRGQWLSLDFSAQSIEAGEGLRTPPSLPGAYLKPEQS